MTNTQIKLTPAFQTADGKAHPTLEEAQGHALANLFDADTTIGITPRGIAGIILENKDAVHEILSATGPRPRKKRVSKKTATPTPKAS